jgi:hydrogenase nickel incorporation protein HypA/HybF
MHELTLANNLVALAGNHAAERGAFRVTRINIRLGELCGIARALYFCFGPAARGTLCDGAELHITEVPVSVHCEACGGVKRPRTPYNIRCPDCGHRTRQLVTGREMELVSIELDGPAVVAGCVQTDQQSQGRAP